MKNFYECKTEDEKQKLRDDMLSTVYYQVLQIRKEVSEVKDCVNRMEQKLIYVGATAEERKYINVDGTIKYDVINDVCDNVLELFGDKYIEEVDADGKTER